MAELPGGDQNTGLHSEGVAGHGTAGTVPPGAAGDHSPAPGLEEDTEDEGPPPSAQQQQQQQQPAADNGSGTDTDDDGELIRKARDARASAMAQRRKAMASAPKKRPAATGRSRAGSGISMKTLIDEGLLWPGEDVLSVDYKQQQTLASLTPEGKIAAHIGGGYRTFESPSAFSIFLKRLVNPDRKADDGWKTVKFGGKYLEHYKLQLAMRRYPNATSLGAGGGGGAAAAPPPAPRASQRASASRRRSPSTSISEDEDEDDDDEDFEEFEDGDSYEVRPRAPKRPRRAPASPPKRPTPQHSPSATRQPSNLGPHRQQQQQVGPPPQSQPQVPLMTGGPSQAAISAFEQALRQRHTGGAVLANGAGGGELFTPQSAASATAAAASDRPRREIRPPPRMNAQFLDEHQMVRCEEYRTATASGAPGSQPFSVAVAPAALLAMDFHAHLSDHEVIGMLGGTFDAATRSMRILRAFPVQELPGEGGSIDVEMDPVDEAAVRSAIQEQHGMRCIGWYHSHPSFAAMPSVIDIANQARQQIAHRDEDAGGAEPYVAAIVSPYCRASPSPQSTLTWFRVEHPLGRLPSVADPMAVGCKPVRVVVQLDGSPTEDAHAQALPAAELPALARRYATKASRAELRAEWKDGMSCADKLRASLAARLPGSWPDDAARRWAAAAADAAVGAWNAAGGNGVAGGGGSAAAAAAPPEGGAEHDAGLQRSAQNGGSGALGVTT